MDKLMELFERFVVAQEAIAEALTEIHNEGLKISGASLEAGEETEPTPVKPKLDLEDDKSNGKGKELTLDDVRAAVRDFSAEKGEDAAIAVLKKFKAAKISEVKKADFQKVIDACAV